MGFFKDIFSKKDEFDPLRDLELSKLRVGYMLDYDMKTWQVTGQGKYDYGDGGADEEWELASSGETIYLSISGDEEQEWSVCKRIPIAAIEGDVRKYIMENDDPPNQMVFEGQKYYLDESGAGLYRKNDKDNGEEFIVWDFIHKDDKRFISIEQWGETDFEAFAGHVVEEYQFMNILPGKAN